MKTKIIFLIIVFALFVSVSAVSAGENSTDVIGEDSNATAEVEIQATEISAGDVTSCCDLEDNFTVSLSSDASALSNKTVSMVLNGVDYNGTTDDFGHAVFSFRLKNGTYPVSYSFAGDDGYAPSNGTATILVKPDITTYLKVVDEDINYRQGQKSLFTVKLTDVNANPIANQSVTIQVSGNVYNLTTNKKGKASVYLSLKKGNRSIEYSFNGTGLYLSSNGTFNVTVRAKLSKGNGYWVNKWDMLDVNLKKLSKLGTKHLFLMHTAVDLYGEAKVLKWIKKAHKYGMKVHMWISVFYQNGKFTPAANMDGSYSYGHMASIINRTKYYASLKGVDGIHFDYIRYGGTAYKYENSVKAINYFVKTASKELRNVSSDIILSAAVMPEPNGMKYYYGQDVSTMSKYLDSIVPMVYKGNYHASAKWIKKTTKAFVKLSKGALIWTGLQTYRSDWDLTKLSYKELLKDAKAAKKGGASGVVLFRWGLSELLNFNDL